MSEVTFTDADGTVRLRGTLDGGSQPLTARIPISAAEILAFGTAAPRKVIVAGQGAGTFVMPRVYIIEYFGGTNPYVEGVGGESFGLGWGDDGAGGMVVVAQNTLAAAFGGSRILEQTDDKIIVRGDGAFDFDANGNLGADPADLDDADLTFGFNNGEQPVTGGDGTLVVTVTYQVIDL